MEVILWDDPAPPRPTARYELLALLPASCMPDWQPRRCPSPLGNIFSHSPTSCFPRHIGQNFRLVVEPQQTWPGSGFLRVRLRGCRRRWHLLDPPGLGFAEGSAAEGTLIHRADSSGRGAGAACRRRHGTRGDDGAAASRGPVDVVLEVRCRGRNPSARSPARRVRRKATSPRRASGDAPTMLRTGLRLGCLADILSSVVERTCGLPGP